MLLRSDLQASITQVVLDGVRTRALQEASKIALHISQVCLQEAETQGRHLIYHTGPGDKYKANAAVLVASWTIS